MYQKPDNSLERRLVQAPLPILIPLAPGEPLPEFVPIPPEPTGQVRLKRSDVRIEDEPFLPLIRLHRLSRSLPPITAALRYAPTVSRSEVYW